MKEIRFTLISALVLIVASGCSASRHVSAPRASEAEITPAEVYQRWNPENALREAERDIRQNTVKIFLHGGIAAFPTGVEPQEYELIEGLRYEEAGVGCVVVDAKLRRMQSEFATIYNRRIIEWLRESQAEPGAVGNEGHRGAD